MASSVVGRKASQGNAFVYVIEIDGGPVKIGRTNNSRLRLREFQMACPLPMKIAFQREMTQRQSVLVETAVHRRFRQAKVRGEWFEVSAVDAAKAINEIAQNIVGDPTDAASRGQRNVRRSVGKPAARLVALSDSQRRAWMAYRCLFEAAEFEAGLVRRGHIGPDGADGIERLAAIHGAVCNEMDPTDVSFLVEIVGRSAAVPWQGDKRALNRRLSAILDVVATKIAA